MKYKVTLQLSYEDDPIEFTCTTWNDERGSIEFHGIDGSTTRHAKGWNINYVVWWDIKEKTASDDVPVQNVPQRCEHGVDRSKVYCPPCGPNPSDPPEDFDG